MKTLRPVWLLLLLPFAAVAQPNYPHMADSLLQLTGAPRPDTAKARLFCEVAECYIKNNRTDSALLYARIADSLQQKQQYAYGIARAAFVLGKIYSRSGELDKAVAAYNKARRITEKDTGYQARRLFAIATGNLSAVIGKKGYPDRELEMLLTVIPVFESLKDSASLAVSMFNIASKFINAGQPGKAYPYLMKNIELVRLKGQPDSRAAAYITAATLQLQLDSLPQAGEYLSQARSVLDTIGANSLWGAYYLYAALYNSKKANYREAEQLCAQAATVIELYHDRNNLYNLLTAEMKIYTAQQKYIQAITAAHRIYAMSIEDRSAYYHLSSLKDLYELEEKAGHPQQSFTYLKAYATLKDSLDQQQIKLHLNELEQQYQASEKEKNILELKSQNDIQRLALQHGRFRQTIYLVALFCFVLVLFLLFLLLRNRQRISRQRHKLLEQELEKVKHEQQINNYASMLNGQEQERSRLARELHDGLGGRLSAIQLNLDRLPEETGEVKNKLSRQLGDSMAELRQIARSLTPETLSRFGLAEALKDYCHTLKEAGVNIIFQAFDISADIPYPTQLMLYRIVQEVITNAIRHAAASRILVQCSQQENVVYITVEDDGKGFDMASTHKGSGLENIKARINHLNGLLDIQSAPGAGTIINIECKLP